MSGAEFGEQVLDALVVLLYVILTVWCLVIAWAVGLRIWARYVLRRRIKRGRAKLAARFRQSPIRKDRFR